MTARATVVLLSTGERHDHRDRSLDDVPALENSMFERSRDDIQWLLSLPEASRFNHRCAAIGGKR